jgi:hypothetical protein
MNKFEYGGRKNRRTSCIGMGAREQAQRITVERTGIAVE